MVVGKKVTVNKEQHPDSRYIGRVGFIIDTYNNDSYAVWVQWQDGVMISYYLRQLTFVEHEPNEMLRRLL